MVLEAGADLGGLILSARHINTIKSGLLIHLYNIEEALLTQGLHFLGGAIGAAEPRQWTGDSLREWLREAVVSKLGEGGEEGRLKTVFQTSTLLLTVPTMGPQNLKKPSGTWDDKAIALFMKRVNMKCDMPPEMWVRIKAAPKYGDMSPLQFLAERRNAIAHGRRSFEEGANDLQLSDIRTLADTVLDYLKYVAEAFQGHVDTNAHLIPAA